MKKLKITNENPVGLPPSWIAIIDIHIHYTETRSLAAELFIYFRHKKPGSAGYDEKFQMKQMEKNIKLENVINCLFVFDLILFFVNPRFFVKPGPRHYPGLISI